MFKLLRHLKEVISQLHIALQDFFDHAYRRYKAILVILLLESCILSGTELLVQRRNNWHGKNFRILLAVFWIWLTRCWLRQQRKFSRFNSLGLCVKFANTASLRKKFDLVIGSPQLHLKLLNLLFLLPNRLKSWVHIHMRRIGDATSSSSIIQRWNVLLCVDVNRCNACYH
jgi:hypothetical protein